ncbi:hypothetical protein B0H19DRAFT_1057138 [Mycena capillaripes]|nr:hypothetical protein B0H19DRAFT_1057138 [Mycena capillaripes]
MARTWAQGENVSFQGELRAEKNQRVKYERKAREKSIGLPECNSSRSKQRQIGHENQCLRFGSRTEDVDNAEEHSIPDYNELTEADRKPRSCCGTETIPMAPIMTVWATVCTRMARSADAPTTATYYI